MQNFEPEKLGLSLLVIGFGFLFFLVASSILWMAARSDKWPQLVQSLPFPAIFKSQLTNPWGLGDKVLPPLWTFIRGFSRVCQLLGLVVVGLGVLGLIISLLTTLF
ncbi:MAG: hypothetical protein ACRCU5_16210 [Rhizobiaceae bacterium]